MLVLPVRVLLIDNEGKSHIAARVGRGPLLTAEGCNLDDSSHELELKEATLSQLEDVSDPCHRCCSPALEP